VRICESGPSALKQEGFAKEYEEFIEETMCLSFSGNGDLSRILVDLLFFSCSSSGDGNAKSWF